ncbi:MAG: prepilin-type N-terminal cleavage/methylation domain-containing protein [Verrucomicrobiales bacterium]|nr:prepilin-type N-terminal cleavage/methylation domain-containing protein [Verrucomicrobiales bacterium]
MRNHHFLSIKSKRQKSSAFTLIELLIVIVIIAILASVAFPVTALVMEQARRSEANNEVTQLKAAIGSYELEYSKLPFASGSGGEGDLRMDTFQDNIISVLAGYNVDGLNPRKKAFYTGKRAKDAKTAKKPRGGVFGTDEQLQLADPWGREYYIVIDSNYDNILEDLPGAEDEEVRASVAVWSRGKQKDGEDLPKEKWIKSGF